MPALALATMALPAAATDWRPVIADRGTLIHLVDAETLRRGTPVRPAVRTLTVFSKGLRTDYQALEMTNEFDCVGNRVRMSGAAGYNDAGKRTTDDAPIDGRWMAIEPETGFAGLAEVICGKRPLSLNKLAGEVPIAAARKLIGAAPPDMQD